MKVVRVRYDTYHVIDTVYTDENKVKHCQSNASNLNRFGAKKFKCNNGLILDISSWVLGNKKE